MSFIYHFTSCFPLLICGPIFMIYYNTTFWAYVLINVKFNYSKLCLVEIIKVEERSVIDLVLDSCVFCFGYFVAKFNKVAGTNKASSIIVSPWKVLIITFNFANVLFAFVS